MRSNKPVIFLLLLTTPCLGYYNYQTNIPNGDNVAHPCKADTVWAGVGHEAEGGGGARNPFGLAFAAVGHTWTDELCQADSDGDSISNGVELGDPDCTWTSGTTPTRTMNITHPGICEPVESDACKDLNSMYIECDANAFVCPHHTDTGLLKHSMRLANTVVPAVETTYYCQTFDIPSDKKYYLKAAKPIIDNRNVMHHMIVFGCSNTSVEPDVTDRPTTCEMRAGCDTWIAGWGVGNDDGSCYPDDMGVELGQGVFERVVVEVHWNNPNEVASYNDQSGYDLYLSDVEPVKLVGTMAVGQVAISVPPNTPSTTVEGLCTTDCTSTLFPGNINIISTNLHMHLIGKSARLTLYRNGEQLQIIGDVTEWDYNNPTSDIYIEEPVIMQPGDELKMMCEFDSSLRSEETTFGAATSDEMCFGFINYYPKITDFGGCIAYKSVDYCMAYQTNANPEFVGEDCEYARFINDDYPDLKAGLVKHCQTCSTECQNFWGEITSSMDQPGCVKEGGGTTLLYMRLEQQKDVGDNAKVLQGMISCYVDGDEHSDEEDNEALPVSASLIFTVIIGLICKLM